MSDRRDATAGGPGNAAGMPAGSSRLDRRLGVTDATVIGLGAMIGAGVFAALGPAAAAAGPWLLASLAAASLVAYCNATSSAQLAAIYPASGGTYVYGRERLGHVWGWLAGWGFVVGKTASCAAMALTFGAYLAPQAARPAAVAAVVALTAVNHRGVQKTAALTRVILALVLAALAAALVGALLGGTADPSNLTAGAGTVGPRGLLQAAGLLFFAFAGYARIATLGEEVADPARAIPRAILLALGITLVIYAAVAGSALLAIGAAGLAEAEAPLVAAVEAGRLAALGPFVRAGAVVASLGVLLSLIVGVSRTAFAMAANSDLPGFLGAVHPRFKVPHRAELAVGGLVVAAVLIGDLRGAIGFSSFCVLGYYAICNAAAATLHGEQRRWARWLALAGVGGCALLAFSLPVASVVGGCAVLGLGLGIHTVQRLRRRTDREVG
ncbi:APC family permease [soil metagenome]